MADVSEPKGGLRSLIRFWRNRWLQCQSCYHLFFRSKISDIANQLHWASEIWRQLSWMTWLMMPNSWISQWLDGDVPQLVPISVNVEEIGRLRGACLAGVRHYKTICELSQWWDELEKVPHNRLEEDAEPQELPHLTGIGKPRVLGNQLALSGFVHIASELESKVAHSRATEDPLLYVHLDAVLHQEDRTWSWSLRCTGWFQECSRRLSILRWALQMSCTILP